MAGFQRIMVSAETVARLDRARHNLECPQSAEYSEVIVALLNEADVTVDLTEGYQ